MGGAKRRPSIAVCEDDGFRGGLSQSYELQSALRAGICPHLHGSANSAPPIARVARADSASDQCTPIRLPTRPTEMPLKARRPRLAMLNRPMTRPRLSGG